MDLDDFLMPLKVFGRYQKWVIFVVCLPACIPGGIHAYNQVLMSLTPPHWCALPSHLNLSETNENLVKNLSVPFVTGVGYSKCLMYDIDYDAIMEAGITQANASWPTTPCKYGWTFDTSQIASSIVIDFELVCDYSIYPPLALSIFNIGGIIGVLLLGKLSDRVGRRIAYIVCLVIQQTFGLLSSFSSSFWLWVIIRFAVGFTIPAMFQIPFIISLEFVAPGYRSFVCVISGFYYVTGMVILVAMAYFIPNWTILCIVTSVPFFLLLINSYYLPESPRWLLHKKRYFEARKILTEMFSTSEDEMPPEPYMELMNKIRYESLSEEKDQEQPVTGISDLMATPNNRLKAILLIFAWLTSDTVYMGLTYFGPSMGDNPYLSFLLVALVEFPAYLFCLLVMSYWSRRWMLAVSMIVGGVFSLVVIFIPDDVYSVSLVFYLLAKLAMATAYLTVYPFAVELYPTEVRGSAMGFSTTISGVGLVLIPLVNSLGDMMTAIPLSVMGFLGLVGGVAVLWLPETLGKRLPRTLQEGEDFGKTLTLDEFFICCPNGPAEDVNNIDTIQEREERNFLDEAESSGPSKPSKACKRTSCRIGPLSISSRVGLPLVTDAHGVPKLIHRI